MWPKKALEIFRELLPKDVELQPREADTGLQYWKARRQLTELFASERVQTDFLAVRDGIVRPLPGRFWFSNTQEFAWGNEWDCEDPTSMNEPPTQQWSFDNEPRAVGVPGFALVDENSLRQFLFEAKQGTPNEPQRQNIEHKQDFIMRTLHMKSPRKITMAEARDMAVPWLTALNRPCSIADINAEAKRMAALMRELANSARNTSEVGATARRSQSEVRAKSERSQSE